MKRHSQCSMFGKHVIEIVWFCFKQCRLGDPQGTRPGTHTPDTGHRKFMHVADAGRNWDKMMYPFSWLLDYPGSEDWCFAELSFSI